MARLLGGNLPLPNATSTAFGDIKVVALLSSRVQTRNWTSLETRQVYILH